MYERSAVERALRRMEQDEWREPEPVEASAPATEREAVTPPREVTEAA